MIDRLLEDAKVRIDKEMDILGYIDDSDSTDRFLDDTAYCMAMDEIIQENKDDDFFNESQQYINDLQQELIQAMIIYMDKTYKKKGSTGCSGDYKGCYYKEEEDYMAWIKYWQILRGIA